MQKERQLMEKRHEEENTALRDELDLEKERIIHL